MFYAQGKRQNAIQSPAKECPGMVHLTNISLCSMKLKFFNSMALKIKKKMKEKVIKQQVFNSVWNFRTENKKEDGR